MNFFKPKNLTFLWEEFANEKQGTLKSESGDLFVQYKCGSFNCRIGNYTHYINSGGNSYERKFMTGIVEFQNPSKFGLLITKEDFLTEIGKIFNGKDITIGNKIFDSKFNIKSNKELQTKIILKNKELLEQILEINPTRIEITNNDGLFNEMPSKGKYMIYYAKQEDFSEINQLKQIDRLFITILNSLKNNCSIIE